MKERKENQRKIEELERFPWTHQWNHIRNQPKNEKEDAENIQEIKTWDVENIKKNPMKN